MGIKYLMVIGASLNWRGTVVAVIDPNVGPAKPKLTIGQRIVAWLKAMFGRRV